MERPDTPAAPVRIETGIGGLDAILGGGLFKGGIYILNGYPGSGKTTFGNQVAFHHVAGGGRAVYVTLLSEAHARMLFQMRTMTFFNEEAIGKSLVYLNGFSTVETEGLAGLLALIRRIVRDHNADLLVLDGMVTAGALAKSDIDYKKFINELQTWVGFVGCTGLFLTTSGLELVVQPEHTMVDGIFEMATRRADMRWDRQLTVTKFRGSGFLEGSHLYRLTGSGVVVHPRFEGSYKRAAPRLGSAERMATGIAGLDDMLCGGLPRGSATLLMGPSGTGKTTMGLQVLTTGAALGERGLYFGFFEPPPDLLSKSRRMGLTLDAAAAAQQVELVWRPSTECLLDEVGEELVHRVKEGGFERVVIDGLPGFKSALHAHRISSFFTALSDQLADLGATTIITDETRELLSPRTEAPTITLSALFQNIIFLRHVEHDDQIRTLLCVLKARDSGHDRRLREIEIGQGGVSVRGSRSSPPSKRTKTGAFGGTRPTSKGAKNRRTGRKR